MARRLVLSLSILVAALGVAAPAQAETITGTFRYLDRDSAPSFLPDGTSTTTTTRTLRPIVAAKVEIYARPPGANWGSSPVATARTDDSGAISVPVTQLPGTTYALRVYAFNDAAAVWQKVVLPTGPFWEEPGRPEGAAIRLPAPSPTGTVDFSWDFNDFWTAAHYNVADTIRLGRQYALARRHPVESASNPIPEVSVQPSSGWAGVSHYNFTIDQLLIKDNDMFDDVTLLHEYAHFLEEKISKFAPIASNHDGCKATMVGDATATPINSPEHAWMEGFADYFAAAVISSLPGGRTDVFGIATAAGLEAPPGIFSVPSCTLVRSTFPADTIELDVAAVLWDLLDGGFNESADTVSGRDEEIFRIFDQELSTPSDPTIEDFRAAWVARGLPAAALGRIYTLNGLTFRRNLAPIADAGPNRYVDERKITPLDGLLQPGPRERGAQRDVDADRRPTGRALEPERAHADLHGAVGRLGRRDAHLPPRRVGGPGGAERDRFRPADRQGRAGLRRARTVISRLRRPQSGRQGHEDRLADQHRAGMARARHEAGHGVDGLRAREHDLRAAPAGERVVHARRCLRPARVRDAQRVADGRNAELA